MKSPKQILEKIESIQERIDLVARDFKSGENQFAKIPAHELAELLALFPGDGDWWRTACVSRETLDDPIYNYLKYLEGHVTAGRITELDKKSNLFEEGILDEEAKLLPQEKTIIEDAIAEETLENGGGWIIAGITLNSSDNTELDFQAEIGDAGECFGCYSPYEIRDGKGANTGGVHEGETW